MEKKLVSHPAMVHLCVLLDILPLIKWGMEIGMTIVPFRYSYRKIFHSSAWHRHYSSVKIKQLGPFQETAIVIVTLRPLCSTGLETHHTSASLSMALTIMAAYPEVSPMLNCLFVLWEHSCWEQTTAEQWANSQRAPASWTAPSFGSQDGTVTDASQWSCPYLG